MTNSRLPKVGAFVQSNMPWVILIVISVIFSLFNRDFFSVRNIINILNQNAYIIIAAIGIAFIMLSGSIDLSTGFQMSVIGVVSGILLTRYNIPTFGVTLIAFALGITMCMANTLIAHKLNLSLLMVTVGTTNVYQGISFTISKSETITGFSSSFKFLGQGNILNFSFPIILATVLFFIMSFYLNRTYMGRFVYALGGNPEASRLAGINVLGVKIMNAVISGTFVALSTLMLISRLGTSQSNIGPGTEFTVITGILVGGISIRGGEGKLSGVVAGILIMAVLSNGMQMAGLGVYAQYIVKGTIMLLAISFDVFQMKRRQIDRNSNARGGAK